MISLEQLWIPIVLSAVLVFAASALIHMVFKWHNSDYRKLANEDEVRAAIRSSSPAPGQYMIPHCGDPKEMQKPEMLQKFKEGPDGFLTLVRPGAPSMGKPLALWFLLNLIIACAVGYLACHTVPFGVSFLAVCRFVGIVTFLAYAGGSVSHAIWMGKPWNSAAKEVLDAFIYGLVSAVAFGWLWPR
jgi:Flp pilus assembly protein TadB